VITEIEATEEKIKETMLSGDNVVRIDYDDQPNDVADKFASMLQKHGFNTEIYYCDDVPYLLYKISNLKKDSQ